MRSQFGAPRSALWICAIATFALGGGGAAWARGASSGSTASTTLSPAQLVAALHQVNLLEIDAGKLAQDGGSAKAVKEYGQKLETDHRAADVKITEYARENNISLSDVPAHAKAQAEKLRTKMDELRNVSGAKFDRQFAQTMKTGHDEVIKMIDASRPGVTDQRLQAVLGSLEPTLRAHRQIAENILKAMGATSPRT